MKVLKIVLIVLISIVVLASGGLLAYGASMGAPQGTEIPTAGLLAAPATDLYLGKLDSNYTMTKAMTADSRAEKVANMLIYATYNHINVDHWYFISTVEAKAAGQQVNSQYFHVQEGVNSYHESAVSAGIATRRMYFYNTKVEDTGGATYKNGTFATNGWGTFLCTKKSVTPTLKDPTPYAIYSWFDLPVDLGDEILDFSLINSSASSIEESAAYYTVTLIGDVTAMNTSDESKRRAQESTGDQMTNIVFKEVTITAEIWKDSGLFRQIDCNMRIIASAGGDRGEGTITRSTKFNYDDVACSVAKWIHDGDRAYAKKLDSTSKTKYDEEYAAIKAIIDAAK